MFLCLINICGLREAIKVRVEIVRATPFLRPSVPRHPCVVPVPPAWHSRDHPPATPVTTSITQESDLQNGCRAFDEQLIASFALRNWPCFIIYLFLKYFYFLVLISQLKFKRHHPFTALLFVVYVRFFRYCNNVLIVTREYGWRLNHYLQPKLSLIPMAIFISGVKA